MRKPSATKLLGDFLIKNVGKIVTSDQLRDASGGIHSWDRRVRELPIWLLAQIRRAGIDEQAAVLKWLKKKFGDPSTQV